MTMNEKITRAAENKIGCIIVSKDIVIAYERNQCRIMCFNAEKFHSVGSRVVLPESATAEEIKAVIERLTKKH